MRLKHNCGSFTLELIVAVLILSLISVDLIRLLYTTYHFENAVDAEYAHIRVHTLLDTGIKELDYNRLLILPRIHKKGALTYADGSPNPIIFKIGDNAPKTASDAITFFTIRGINIARIYKLSAFSDTIQVFACPTFTDHFDYKPRDKPESFLLISIDSIQEFVGLAHSEIMQGKPCWRIQGNLVKGMLTPKHSKDLLPFYRYIVPIKRIYTLFVSNNNTVRYLGHLGSKNIENQPIVTGISALQLSSLLNTYGLYVLKAHVLATSGYKAQATFSNNLSKFNVYTFLGALSNLSNGSNEGHDNHKP